MILSDNKFLKYTLLSGGIFLISIDNDGVEENLNYDVLYKSRSICNLPILYGGGVNNNFQIKKIKEMNFDGVVISNFLHKKNFSVLKKYL